MHLFEIHSPGGSTQMCARQYWLSHYCIILDETELVTAVIDV